jgi:hypothetical protein
MINYDRRLGMGLPSWEMARVPKNLQMYRAACVESCSSEASIHGLRCLESLKAQLPPDAAGEGEEGT